MLTNEYLSLADAKTLIQDKNYEWKHKALCINVDSLIFLPSEIQGKSLKKIYTQAKQYCFQCPVRTECLAYALVNDLDLGIFGGLTPEERKSLHNKLPVREIFKKKDSKWKNDSDAKSANT